jgi:hypothetical protein
LPHRCPSCGSECRAMSRVRSSTVWCGLSPSSRSPHDVRSLTPRSRYVPVVGFCGDFNVFSVSLFQKLTRTYAFSMALNIPIPPPAPAILEQLERSSGSHVTTAQLCHRRTRGSISVFCADPPDGRQSPRSKSGQPSPQDSTDWPSLVRRRTCSCQASPSGCFCVFRVACISNRSPPPSARVRLGICSRPASTTHTLFETLRVGRR